MKSDLQELAAANPVTPEAGAAWAMTAEAESSRRRALDGVWEAADDLTRHRSPRIRWPAALVGAALVLILALPALLFLGDESPQTTTTTIPVTTTSVTVDTIPVVEEVFYTAVLQCLADETGNDFGPVTVDEDGLLTTRGRRALDAAAAGYPRPYRACYEITIGLGGSLQSQSFALNEGTASILVPSGWNSTTDDLTPNVGDPWERISIGTYPLVPTVEGGDSCALQALEDLSPDDVFIQILERSGSALGFEPRAPTFAGRLTGLDEGDYWECLTPDERSDLGTLRWLSFEIDGRGFYALVALGSETGEDELHTVELILDRIVIQPEIAPGWTFTEILFTVREGSAYAIGNSFLFAWSGAPDRIGDMRRDGILINTDTATWKPVPDAPIQGRYSSSVVWTGTEFIVFGGHSFTESLVDGAAYDPTAGTWRQIAS
ncbi:MAG: kelch repeat-containing protein, partial [Acidimicrobiia bacterium]